MQIVTANRLIDGRVVFRDADGRWVEAFADAAVVADTAAALAEAAKDEASGLVVGAYAVDVVTIDGRVEPKAQREKIRVTGPTSGSEARAARVA